MQTKQMKSPEDLYIATRDAALLKVAFDAVVGCLSLPEKTRRRLAAELERHRSERSEAVSRILDKIGTGP